MEAHAPISAHPFTNPVRTRLRAGGRRIRTLGPPRDRDNGSPFDRSGTSPCCGRVNEIRIRKYCPACFAFARRGRPLLGHPGNAGDDRIPFVGSRYSAKSRSRNLPSSRNSAARILAARQLGIAEIPVMVAAGWSEAQKRAYVLADNQLAITGSGWDTELLRLELGELNLAGFDLSLTDRPPFDLVRRPRPLIFRAPARGRAHASTEGKC
jgi:hypothetical protein